MGCPGPEVGKVIRSIRSIDLKLMLGVVAFNIEEMVILGAEEVEEEDRAIGLHEHWKPLLLGHLLECFMV